MITAAEELRTAAAELRTAATAARSFVPEPWTITREQVIRAANDDIVADRSGCRPGDDGDLPYIAAMHPGTGTALADWLKSWTEIDTQEDGPMPEDLRHALAVARAINMRPR